MADETDSSVAARQAIRRALPLIQASAVEFTKHRDCFSCHHQALPVRVLTTAANRGWVVDAQIIKDQVNWTAQFLKRNQERYLQGQGQGGQVDTAGYALWTLAAGSYAADDVTAAVCHYLLVRHADQAHWPRTSNRPPSEASDFTTTFLALQALRNYATDQQRPDVERKMEQARKWFEQQQPADTEDLVFRLRGLCTAQSDRSIIEAAATQLLAAQREDGGWAQAKDMTSDAYATGSALTTLLECQQISAADDRCRRGLQWLVENQQADGSWHVVSRSEPFQTYFETGFPHGKDQFISAAASCWAVLALLMASENPADGAETDATDANRLPQEILNHFEQLGAQPIRDNTRLIGFRFDGTRIRDDDLKGIEVFTEITDLSFERTELGDEGLEHLRALPHLEWLNLYRTQVTDRGLEVIAQLPAVRYLPLGETQITDAGLAHIGKLNRLRYLGVRGIAITDAGLKHLADLRLLEGLHLGGTEITDAGIQHLQSLTGLRELWLQNTAVTDASVDVLAKISGLRQVVLAGTQVTQEGLRRLKQALPKCHIVMQIDDDQQASDKTLHQ